MIAVVTDVKVDTFASDAARLSLPALQGLRGIYIAKGARLPGLRQVLVPWFPSVWVSAGCFSCV